MSQDSYMSDESAMRSALKKLDAGKTSFWKPEVGDTTIRIMPRLPGQKTFWLEVPVHFVDGKSSQCLANEATETSCVACELSEKLMASDNTAYQEKGARIQVKSQYLVNIAVDHGSPDAVSKVWAVPQTIIRDLISLYFSDYRGFDHPVNGSDIVINRVGQMLQTRYKVTPRRSASKTTKTLMAGRKDLTKVTRIISADEFRTNISNYIKKSKA